MKRNPIIKRYVSKIRNRLACRKWYKNKNKKKRNPIIKRYVSKIKKRLWWKKYNEKNREKQLEYKTKWRKNNKEKLVKNSPKSHRG